MGQGDWNGGCLNQGSDQTPLHLTVCGDHDAHGGSSAALRKQSELTFGWNFHSYWGDSLGLHRGRKCGIMDIRIVTNM